MDLKNVSAKVKVSLDSLFRELYEATLYDLQISQKTGNEAEKTALKLGEFCEMLIEYCLSGKPHFL